MKRIKHDIELKHISAETKKEIFALCFREGMSAHAVEKPEGWEIRILNATVKFHEKILEILQDKIENPPV